MMLISTLFEQAQLAEASYANFWDTENNTTITKDDDVQTALKNLGFSKIQAEEFTTHWEVVSHQPNLNSGFSATLFKNKLTQEYTFANRGTETSFPELVPDVIAADLFGIVLLGKATHQLVDMYRYFRKLETPAGETVNYTTEELTLLKNFSRIPIRESAILAELVALETGKTTDAGIGALSNNSLVSVTGHSLGGHLATWFSAFFGSRTYHSYTYNGAGLGGFSTEVMDLLTRSFRENKMSVISNDSVTNIYGEKGLELTAGTGDYIGSINPIFIESQGDSILGNLENHSSILLTNSLAIYKLINGIDTSLTLDQITNYLEGASNTPPLSLEAIVNSIGNILNVGTTVDIDNRNDLHTRLQVINEELYIDLNKANPQLKAQYQNLKIVDVNTLSNSATLNNADGLAYRYALSELNTFAITGNASLYDADKLKAENFSDQYLIDRAQFLSLLITANTEDKPYTQLTQNSEHVVYKRFNDGILTHQFSVLNQDDLNTPNSPELKIIGFSDNSSGSIPLEGFGQDDRLYGGSGDDIINGHSGNDYLEGGAGDDTLTGGKGRFDIVDGGIGKDTYIFNIGDQQMTIRDADMNGLIILKNGVEETILGIDNSIKQIASNVPVYGDEKGNRFVINGSRLFITTAAKEKIIVESFTSGNLGIILPTFVKPPIKETTIMGDLAYKDFDPGTNGIQTQVDALGNIIQIPDQIEEKQDHLFGSTNADIIQSGALNDIVKGKAGDDFIEGGSGSDILVGGNGNDRLFADKEADFSSAFNSDGTLPGFTRDWLSGGDGNDQLIGSTGADVLSGGGGHDLLVAGAGNDFIFGDRDRTAINFNWTVIQTGNDYTFTSVSEVLPLDPDGADAIYAGGGDDVVWAGGNNDNVFGGSGNDYLLGENGDDNLFGDAGNDTLSGGQGDDLLIGGTGKDLLLGRDDNDLLYGNEGDDELQGGRGEDKLFGGDGIDLLIGNEGKDILLGENGNDQLQGHEDNDILKGGQGDDTIVGGSGDDTLFGGTGNDLLLGDYSDNIIGVLNQLAGNDTLIGGSGNDNLYGFKGDDQLTGGTGDDLLKGGEDNDQYFLTLGDGQDTIDDIEGENKLIFASTQSTLISSLFQDIDGADYLALQYGEDDTVYIKGGLQGSIKTYRINGIEVHYSDFIGQTLNEAIDYQMTNNSGALYASRFDDTVKGSHSHDIIYGQDGNDILTGEAGIDRLEGGSGSDWLQGGLGADTLVFSNDSSWSNHFIAYNAGSPGYKGTGERVSISNMQRSHDLFDGGEGQDTLQGTEGNDAVFLHDTFSPLPNGTGPRIKNIELFRMGAGDDIVDLTSPIYSLGNVTLIGEDGNDTLWGSSGNDRIFGGQGNDKLSGGVGNDNYYFARGDDQDTIKEHDTTASNHDVLNFSNAISHDQLWFSQQNNDLLIQVIGTLDQVSIANWYKGDAFQIEELRASDDFIVKNNQIAQLVSAMASFNPPSIGELSLSDEQQQQLAPVLASSWAPLGAFPL